MPACTGALDWAAFACAMIAAKEPFGGGFDCTGATAGAGWVGLAGTFWGATALGAADVLLFAVGLDRAGFDGIGRDVMFETGFGTALGAAGETAGFMETAGFDTTGLLGIFDSSLEGRGSGSSAFRFVPLFPLIGGAWRKAGDFLSSFLGAAAGAGEAGG